MHQEPIFLTVAGHCIMFEWRAVQGESLIIHTIKRSLQNPSLWRQRKLRLVSEVSPLSIAYTHLQALEAVYATRLNQKVA